MSERDPRVDPEEGDIIRFGGKFNAKFYEVLDHDPRMAQFDVSAVSEGRESQRSIGQWREWAAKAEVIRRGDAATGRKEGRA